MRQVASNEIITHPLCLAIITVILGIMTNFMPHTSVSDFSLLATTWAGTIVAALLGVRLLSSGFIEQAEKIGWTWMEDSRTQSWGSDGSDNGQSTGRARRKEEAVVVVTKWGERMIAAVIMRVVKRERRAWVRAWTVERRYRKQGVGRNIMEEAVRFCVVDKGIRGVEVEEGTCEFYGSLVCPSILLFTALSIVFVGTLPSALIGSGITPSLSAEPPTYAFTAKTSLTQYRFRPSPPPDLPNRILTPPRERPSDARRRSRETGKEKELNIPYIPISYLLWGGGMA